MTDWFEALAAIEKMYLFCAAAGGVLFLIFMGLAFLGGLDHGDAGHAGDVGADIGDADLGTDTGHDLTHADSSIDPTAMDPSFKFLSMQGISSFATMFGVVGLTISKNGGHAALSGLGATVAGFAMLFAMKQIWTMFLRLQSSGTLHMENAVGQEGKVYLRIPADGTGKAEVTVQQRLQVFDAISERKQELATGTPIRVVRIVGGEKVAVEKL